MHFYKTKMYSLWLHLRAAIVNRLQTLFSTIFFHSNVICFFPDEREKIFWFLFHVQQITGYLLCANLSWIMRLRWFDWISTNFFVVNFLFAQCSAIDSIQNTNMINRFFFLFSLSEMKNRLFRCIKISLVCFLSICFGWNDTAYSSFACSWIIKYILKMHLNTKKSISAGLPRLQHLPLNSMII